MLIDWFTVVAQAANFLILVWLLKRFLYKPILNAIDAREKRIAAELSDANARKTEAIAEREEFRHKNEEFDRQLATQRNRITEEAATERKRLFDDAQNEVDDLRAKQLEMLESEFQTLSAEIERRTQDEAFAIARHALTELAGVDIESRMVEIFVRRLREMDAAEKAELISGRSSSSPVIVRSAFELAAERRTLIEKAIRNDLAPDFSQVIFETVPGLIGGVELFLQGRKAAWSVADYLNSQDKSVGELLKSQRRAGAGGKAS